MYSQGFPVWVLSVDQQESEDDLQESLNEIVFETLVEEGGEGHGLSDVKVGNEGHVLQLVGNESACGCECECVTVSVSFQGCLMLDNCLTATALRVSDDECDERSERDFD